MRRPHGPLLMPWRRAAAQPPMVGWNRARYGKGDMADVDIFKAYRKMFTSAEDGLVAWWYVGGAFVAPDGYPEMPVIEAETVMVYRTETLDADRYRIHWWEIGVFRDPISGGVASRWRNPVTGDLIATPQAFEEGPAAFTITRNGSGISVHLVQANAHVRDVTVTARETQGRVFLNQVERKVRGFPLPDGRIPDPDSADAFDAVTVLSIFSDLADIESEAPNAPSTGVYSLNLPALPPWMKFGAMTGANIVRGRMEKSPAVNAQVNPAAWARLKAAFPDRFDGDALIPKWD